MSKKPKKRVGQAKAIAMPSRPFDLNDRWMVPGVCIFLVGIIWAVFGQTLRYGFVNFDDPKYVYQNPDVTGGLSLKGIAWAFVHVHAANWHPLTWISHMLDCQFYGLNAGGHHFTNILLHTAATILLFLVLRQMTGALWRSAFVATMFAIHPLHVESVAWVAERKDVLSGLFFMLTIGAYVRFVRHPWSVHRYLMVTLMLALGLMSKPMLVTLPFVLLLLDYWPLGRVAAPAGHHPHFPIPRQLILEKLPWFGLAAASCLATILAQKEALKSFETIPLPLRAGNALISCVAYLRQMFWPADMVVFYPFSRGGVGVSEVIFSLVLLAGISTGVFLLRRHHPWLLTGWLWYLGMLVPVIGLMQVGAQARADRYTYMPQIGLYLALTWEVADFCARWRYRRLVLGSLSSVILVALIFCARAQTSCWRNSESLWTHTLACTSDNLVAHLDLGEALVEQGRTDDAIFHFQQALQIRPGYAETYYNFGNALLQQGRANEAIDQFQRALQIRPDYADAHFNLGVALVRKGNVDEAITHFQRALQLKPDDTQTRLAVGNALLQQGRADEAMVYFQKALQAGPDNADAQVTLGNALLQQGHVNEAMVCFQKALQTEPDSAEAHCDLGAALFRKGDIDAAIAQFRAALQIKPGFAEAHLNLGSALVKKGQVNEAIIHFQRALEIDPDNVEALNDLAWLLATSPQASVRNGNQAVELAQRANQVTGGESPMILSTLAAAYAAAGRFGDAQQGARKAVELATAAGQQGLVEELTRELKLYEAGLPYHDAGK
jgi:tetratricopeptide (TPR) repeat protein